MGTRTVTEKNKIPIEVDLILADAKQAAEMLSISPSHLYSLANMGLIGPQPIALARSKRYIVSELRAWADAGCPRREVWEEIKENASGQKTRFDRPKRQVKRKTGDFSPKHGISLVKKTDNRSMMI